jgi:hypothetical protein
MGGGADAATNIVELMKQNAFFGVQSVQRRFEFVR